MPLAELTEDGEHIRVELDAPYREKDLISMVPGARWKPDWDGKPWSIPTSWAACKILRGIFGDNLRIGDNLAKWSWEEYESRVKPCSDLRMLTEPPEDHPLLDVLNLVKEKYAQGV